MKKVFLQAAMVLLFSLSAFGGGFGHVGGTGKGLHLQDTDVGISPDILAFCALRSDMHVMPQDKEYRRKIELCALLSGNDFDNHLMGEP